MVFFALLLMVSLGFFTETLLALVGLHKGAVLNTFEKYGGEDPVYYPWARVFFWLGMLAFSAGAIFAPYLGSLVIGNLAGVLFLMLAFGARQYQHYIVETGGKILVLMPPWYRKLLEITSRYERRRIAYMWLHLPLRTRLIYNASDRLFFQWAELVIMSTTREA